MPYDTAHFLITQGASSQIYNTCGYWISLVCIFMFSGLFVAPLVRTNTCVEASCSFMALSSKAAFQKTWRHLNLLTAPQNFKLYFVYKVFT